MLLKCFIALLVLNVLSCSVSAQSGNEWRIYRTDGHSKSNGINLTIKYPATWAALEGERPHVVQKFVSPERGTYVMILIQDLGVTAEDPMTQEELNEFFSLTGLRGMVPEGMHFVNAQITAIEGLPAGILEYRATMDQAGATVDMQVWSVNLIYQGSLIQLQCAVGAMAGAIDLAAEMLKKKPVFLQMANSMVLPDKWTTAASDPGALSVVSNRNPEAPPIPRAYGDNLGAILLVSLVVTWGIGLTPPIVVRFALARMPLSKGSAIGLTVLFWVFNLMLFTALGSESKSHSALVLVAFASYAILRKGADQRTNARQ